jgi:uncharacterized SAM-binding protein YcdF (DUF218 family)
MFLLKKILAALVLPPSGPLLLALLGFVLARRRPRLGYSVVALAVATIAILSVPWVANSLLRSLEDTVPPTMDQVGRTQAIVILGGAIYRRAPEYDGKDTVSEFALERVRYGARLARASKLPIALAGGIPPAGDTSEAAIMQEVLQTDFGLASRWLETQSLDTWENAAFLAPRLKEAGVREITLVTHAWHMRRAQAAFEKQGLSVLPAPTRFTPVYRGIIPRAESLRNSSLALHEWLGLLATGIADGTAQ